jgi:hypothetical protein
LVGEDPSLTLTLQSSATRGGRQAIYAAIDMLLLEDIMETGLMKEISPTDYFARILYARPTRSA